MKRKYLDLVSGFAFLALAIALYFGSKNVKTLDVSRFGGGFFPSIVAVLLAITSLGIILGGIAQAGKPNKEEPQANTESSLEKSRRWAVLVTFLLMFGYALLISKLGFIITTALYLFIQINILSPKKSRHQLLFAIISVLSSIIIYYTFVKLFNLMLPAGILG